MQLKKLISLVFLASLINVYGQDSASFKGIFMEAEYDFITGNYKAARDYYEDLLIMDPENSNLHFLNGYCRLKVGGTKEEAISSLEKAVLDVTTSYKEGSYKERQAPLEAFFQLARAYHINNEFERAIELYTKYRELDSKMKFADIEYINAQIKSCELSMSMINDPINVSFYSAGDQINLNNESYSPVISGNDSVLIFAVHKPLKEFIMMSVKQENGWSEPRSLNNELGLTGNFSPVSLSYNGTELYLAQKEYFEADIYVSHLRNHSWSGVIKLNKNINSRYLESHACISRDNQTLYFTSDRPNGQGGLDIYMSVRESGDNWGEAVNLGSTVNSFYNEDTPFIIKNDSKLYFSSQGHATMGGYDIFYTEKTEDKSWTMPVNIGYPLSTSDDDLFYNPGWNEQSGYYSFINASTSPNKNIYSVRINSIRDLSIGIRREGEVRRGRAGENLIAGTSHATPGNYYILNSILFDFDDHTLDEAALREVERIYMLMREYPEIGIELSGHADAWESAESKMELARKRSEEVASYLTSKGIQADRMEAKVVEKENPVETNAYEDGADAPDGRILNRHVSIKINNLQHDSIRVADIFVPEDFTPAQNQTFTVLLTESEGIIDSIQVQLLDEPLSRIYTGTSNIYTAGNFERKTGAMKFLNTVLDLGYPQARMMEKKMLEDMIREKLKGDPFQPSAYTIQFIALKNPVDITHFRDLENIRKYVGKDGFNRYVSGEYKSINLAMKYLFLARQLGYEDAFIMPLVLYERISVR